VGAALLHRTKASFASGSGRRYEYASSSGRAVKQGQTAVPRGAAAMYRAGVRTSRKECRVAHQYVSWASSAGRLGRSLSDDVALRIETRDFVIDLQTHTVWTVDRVGT
jgi:hypothetical protein